MNITHYLQRIHYADSTNPDAKILKKLHIAHLRSVPFENLDIGLKRPIRLTEQALWEKIVINKRGGFCYELNGIFAWLLKQIGFEVTYLNARVFNRDGNLGIDFDHLALLVQAPGKAEQWLVDVGFGDSFIEPLIFKVDVEQPQGLRAYRIDPFEEGYVTMQRNYDGTWEKHYFFDLQSHNFPAEYEAGCLYHQTSPDSWFTRGSIISRATEDGRVSLEDGMLILTKNGQREERTIEEGEYITLLKQYYNIEL